KMTQIKIEELTKEFENQKKVKDQLISENTGLQVKIATLGQEIKTVTESIHNYVRLRLKLEEDIKRKIMEQQNNREEISKEKTRVESLAKDKKKLKEELLEFDIK